MPWNGSGTYSPPGASFPEVNGTTIDATRFNATINDIASGVTAALAKNGENTPTANLPMGSFKHTGAAVGTATGQYMTWGQTVAAAVGSAASPSYTFNGDSDTGMYRIGVDSIGWAIGGSSAWVINASGSLSNSTTEPNVGGSVGKLNIHGTSATFASSFVLARWSADAAAPIVRLGKSRGASIGTQGAVTTSDDLGSVNWMPSDGVDNDSTAARIRATATEVHSATVSGTQLEFATVATGTNTFASRLVVNNSESLFQTKLRIEEGTSGGAAANSVADTLVLDSAVSGGITIRTPAANSGFILFGDEASSVVGGLEYEHATNSLQFRTSSTEWLHLTSDGRLYGTALHNNAGAVTGTTNQYLASGTWTATSAGAANVSAITVRQGQWMRVGNVVHCTTTVTLTTSGSPSTAQLRLSLPIASDFTTAYQAIGTLAFSGNTNMTGAYIVSASATNDVLLTWSNGSNAAGMDVQVIFSYEVL